MGDIMRLIAYIAARQIYGRRRANKAYAACTASIYVNAFFHVAAKLVTY